MSDLEKGDRIVVRGLANDDNTSHLEGCHGSVALVRTAQQDGRERVLLAVHVDMFCKTFLVHSEHVVREDPLEKHSVQNCATVQDGVLEATATPTLGLPLMRALAIVRWIVATQYLAKTPNSNADYKALKVQQVPMLPWHASLELNAYAIQHWNDKYGVRACLTSFVHQEVAPGGDNQQYAVEKRFIARALQSKRAMKAWNFGLQGDFWFVGRDYTGSFVVPDKNKDMVYKIVGICRNGGPAFKKPGEAVSLNPIPNCMAITIVPWFGRLLYDTTVLVPPAQLKRANESKLAHLLHETVLKSIQKSTAIEYFAELEQ